MAVHDRPDLNRLFDALRHPYRRFVLYYVHETDHAVSMDSLVTALVDWERTNERPKAVDRDKIASRLYHTHLPKLEADRFVTYDRASDRLTVGARPISDRPLWDELEEECRTALGLSF